MTLSRTVSKIRRDIDRKSSIRFFLSHLYLAIHEVTLLKFHQENCYCEVFDLRDLLFDRIPTCDGQTDGQTSRSQGRGIYHACIASL